MRSSVLAAGLLLSLLLSACGSSGAAKNPTSKPVVAPVVATSFSNLRPTGGQREAVSVQFFKGKQRLPGGRLSVSITYGSHKLQVKGSTTDKQGAASAPFTVPRVKKGTVLHATTTVTYKGHQYMGSNQVKVGG